mmetsp:Transcript_6116/g.9993  ORF Transcript_6116/g.9993 Transcript_6116/m.9993 type:complete len:188 (+) Transcript_6116:9-572(+)
MIIVQCVGQELDPEDVAVFSVNPLASEGKTKEKGTVHIMISDPAGSYILEDKVHLGDVREISKDIKLQGVHQMCFKHNSHEPVSVVFTISFKSRASLSKDLKSALKDSTNKNIPSIERQLASAQVLLEDISNEIDYAQKQEDALKEATDSTNSRITWFSYLSMFVLLTSAVWQLFYLRNFFNSKKML